MSPRRRSCLVTSRTVRVIAQIMRGPLNRYHALVDENALEADPAQEEAAERLQGLHEALKSHHPQRKGLFFRSRRPAPKGVYLWGGVGRGKTLLMDLFFNSTPVAKKRRVHFHEFMAQTHERIAQWRAMDERARKKSPYYVKGAGDDPIRPVARTIAREAHLLAFDEFQVSDIADAMILGRLFGALFSEGVVVVATSNRSPHDLYKDGLNRQLFTPFIDLLVERLDAIELVAARDYRLARLAGAPVYYQPLGRGADLCMDKAWERMVCGAKALPCEVRVKGRKVTVPLQARGAARFDFADLFEKPLGANDYLAIVRRFGTLFIDHIPIMGPDMRNEAKRFVVLIDAVYDAKTKLVCSADDEPDALYAVGDGSFEFERTASRLMEMRSAEYLGADHAT